MSEDRSRNPCAVRPGEAVIDCEHFTDDTSCVVHVTDSDINTSTEKKWTNDYHTDRLDLK